MNRKPYTLGWWLEKHAHAVSLAQWQKTEMFNIEMFTRYTNLAVWIAERIEKNYYKPEIE